MPQIRNLEVLEGMRVRVERTTGNNVRGTVEEVYHDAGGHPVIIIVQKDNGNRFLIPWHAVRSLVDDS